MSAENVWLIGAAGALMWCAALALLLRRFGYRGLWFFVTLPPSAILIAFWPLLACLGSTVC